MKNVAFARGAVVGVICAIAGGAAVASAGTGLGVFDLGATNSSNAQTRLVGKAPGSELRVTNTATSGSANGIAGVSGAGAGVFAKNTGSGPAGAFQTANGAPPFTVNSAAKVVKLNADQLDGFSSGSFQQRITGSCASGVASIASTGSVTCAPSVVIQTGADNDSANYQNESTPGTTVLVDHAVRLTVLDTNETFQWTGGIDYQADGDGISSMTGQLGFCWRPFGGTLVMAASRSFHIRPILDFTDFGTLVVTGAITGIAPGPVTMGLCLANQQVSGSGNMNLQVLASWSSYVALEPAQQAGTFVTTR